LNRLRVAIATVLVTAAAGCGSTLEAIDLTPPAAQGASAIGQPVGDAVGALEQLPVKGRAPRTGYEREQFGPAWKDVDRNGCDQRNDVLARDLVDETFRPGTNNCIVFTGSRQPGPGHHLAQDPRVVGDPRRLQRLTRLSTGAGGAGAGAGVGGDRSPGQSGEIWAHMPRPRIRRRSTTDLHPAGPLTARAA